MKNILVVDNDASVRALLSDYLSQHAFRINAVENSHQMVRYLNKDAADLLIVDVNQEQEDGLQLIHQVNAKMDIPVIIISGDRLDETDKVMGLEMGAADYIAKPFGLREFLARVRVALRNSSDRKTYTPQKVYKFDECRVNTKLRRVLDPTGQEIKLTASELNLLLAFLNNPRETLSREQLLMATRVHDQEIFDRSIDVLILRLRRKLENALSGKNYIRTERGAGYIFDGEVIAEDLRTRTHHS